MEASLTRLLTKAIDYAGLFPPAKLEMPAAFSEYVTLREGEHAWIMDRFACNVARLSLLSSEIASSSAAPIEITAIGSGGNTIDEWQKNLEADRAALEKFERSVGPKAAVLAYESRIPHCRNVEACLNALNGFAETDLVVELPWDGDQGDALAEIAGHDDFAAKARLGGADAAAFPSPDLVAEFIANVVQLGLPFKLTAGLHHPFPIDDPATGGKMHGFINVLTAICLALEHDFSRNELMEVLQDRDAAEFRFVSKDIYWKDLRISHDTIEEARDLFIGWGSCSILEPIEDMQKFGLMGVNA
ncbi:MAG: hypothetical protein JSS72_08195 [Armatimonadetes bacterium]|nr:hypothetical protein [Armatimonadota bacterium]